MTTVTLAEKKSVAQDLAKFKGIRSTSQFHIEDKDGMIYMWARGHLLELLEPDDYGPHWGSPWRWEQLPMIPEAFKYRIIRGSGDHMKAIGAMLKKATKLVIATDAGREGELIARLILMQLRWKGPTFRLWASEMTDAGLKKAWADIKPASEYDALYEAAIARQKCDWLFGYAGSRAASLAASNRNTYPVGRVQTPTLALVVRRHLEIANHKARDYFELEAKVTTAKGSSFSMKHAPSKEKRILDRKVAEALAEQAKGAHGPLRVSKYPGVDAPPLPFSLLTLQQAANKKLGLSAANTLKVAQALYDKKVTSYPRTDTEHLTENHKDLIPGLLATLQPIAPTKVAALNAQGVRLRDKVFDNSKIVDHFAIIPTGHMQSLEAVEQQVYDMVVLRFLEALGQDVKFDKTDVKMDANGVEFTATDKVVNSLGWKLLAAA